VEAAFLLAIRAVELLFHPVDPMVAVFPIALLGYGGLYLCFFFFFLLFLVGKLKTRCSSLGCGGVRVV